MKFLTVVFLVQCLFWQPILSRQIIFQDNDASRLQLTSAKPPAPQPTSTSTTPTTKAIVAHDVTFGQHFPTNQALEKNTTEVQGEQESPKDLNQNQVLQSDIAKGTNITRLQSTSGPSVKAPATTQATSVSATTSGSEDAAATNTSSLEELTSPRRSESSNGNLLKVPGTSFSCGEIQVPDLRVVGGREALQGEFPWMAAIGYGYDDEEGFLFKFNCGGALISEQHILTAAHCIDQGFEPQGVRLGDHNLYDRHDGADHQEAFIERIVKHPNFDKRTFENDIAILKLKSKVQFAPNIQPLCLPLRLEYRNATFENPPSLIAGWGRIEWKGRPSAVLQKARVPIVDTPTCADQYRKLKEPIFETNICAGYLTAGGIDACEGDSGGPLMYPQMDGTETQYVAIGVISNGHKCAEPGYPGVYTRVTSYIDWILDVMKAT